MDDQNLSEVLFKPKFNYPETSLISNSGIPLPKLASEKHNLGFTRGWYRSIHRFWWVWQGANLMDIDVCLSAIASSKAPRSRQECFDTVAEYGGGNWIYEFSALAQRRVLEGRRLEEEERHADAAHQYRMASRYFSIAAYPYLKGDVLAADAALLGRRSYRDMFRVEPDLGTLEDFEFEVDGVKSSGLLHLPKADEARPCVVLLASYEMSPTDFYRFYRDHLLPERIALLVLEMPGGGLSQRQVLTAEQSVVLDAALEALAKDHHIDATRTGLLGFRVGGTACLRSTLLNPGRVRALGLVGPAVHSFFCDKEILNSFPLCIRSLYANRLDMDASDWDNVIPQLKPLSLKEQGLMGRGRGCAVPCMAIALNAFTSDDDMRMLEDAFAPFEGRTPDGSGRSEYMSSSLNQMAEFFKQRLL